MLSDTWIHAVGTKFCIYYSYLSNLRFIRPDYIFQSLTRQCWSACVHNVSGFNECVNPMWSAVGAHLPHWCAMHSDVKFLLTENVQSVYVSYCSLFKLKPVWPFSTDFSNQQHIFIHRTAAYWMCFFITQFQVNSRDYCVLKSQELSRDRNPQTSPSGTNNYGMSQSFSHSDGCCEHYPEADGQNLQDCMHCIAATWLSD